MKYLNVDKNNNFVVSDDKKYTRDNLIKNTIFEITKSGVKDVTLEFKNKQFFLECYIDEKS